MAAGPRALPASLRLLERWLDCLTKGVAVLSSLEKWSPYALAAMRIMAGLLFIEHGTMKLWQFPGPQPNMSDPLPLTLFAASWIELVGGALIALGLFTRPAAFICSGTMAFAYFMAHGSQGFWPALNRGDAAILYCFIFFYITFAGPGAFSVDGMLGRKSKTPA